MNKLPPQIVTKYLGKKPDELKMCQDWLAEENFTELSNIGHKFKGNGTTFGFPEFTVLGAQLEQAAKKSDKQTVDQVLQEIKKWVQTQNIQ